MIYYLILFLTAAAVVALDLITKYLSVKYSFDFVVIPKLLKFKQAYNEGAAFGMLDDKPWAKVVFIVLTIAVCLLIIGFFVYNKIAGRSVPKWFGVALALVFAGAAGNCIDRVFLGKVRDFMLLFYDTQIFPFIFNVADVSLVAGVIMLLIWFLFLDKEALFSKKNKNENGNENNNG